jgi:galactose mutarotase-like enzyme
MDELLQLKHEGKIGAIRVSLPDHRHDIALPLIQSGKIDAIQTVVNIFVHIPQYADENIAPATLGSLNTENFAAFKYGTPILFPPNRIKEATFRFRDRTYNFPVNEPPHYHLHGELCTSAWEIVEWGESDSQGATVMNRFRIVDHPEIFAYFPHPLTFAVRYTLLDGRLQMETTIVNEGIDEAPFAFGLHPYFLFHLSQMNVFN